ncbi:hypothetical protein TWF281_003744 [Arthrobotrys megalospora]
MSPKQRRICMDPPQRSNPTTPDTSLLLAENANLTTREECIELCYRMDTFSDVTFRVGNSTIGPFKVYKLHKLVLAGQSTYLYALCVQAAPNETVDLPDVQPYIFDHIVKWLYKAKLTDKTEDMAVLAKIYEVATNLKIKELESKTLDTLQEILQREKQKEEKGGVSILDEMLVKPPPQPQGPGNRSSFNAPQKDTVPSSFTPSLARSNTEGTVSTHRHESKTKEFFKGVMEKVSIHKDTGKEKESTSTPTFSSSFLNRAKTGIRGRDRAASQPIRTSMISHPFGATHITAVPYPRDPGAMPSLAEAKDLFNPPPQNPESNESPKGSTRGSAYRHSTAF